MASSLEELCVSLAWSQWGALGISASMVVAAQHPVDLDAAIVFAPMLATLDPRLHDEVLDWCIQFAGEFASVSCLKHILRLFEPAHHQAFGDFAAIVNAQGGTKWPTTRPARRFSPSGKSICRSSDPAAIQLRARKIFGINARADILTGLALDQSTPEPKWTEAARLQSLGYSRRNISEALNDLHGGGMLGLLRSGRSLYALAKPGALREILAPLPNGVGQPWGERFAFVATLIEVRRRTKSLSITSQAVEVRRALDAHAPNLRRSRILVPELPVGNPWPALTEWLGTQLQP